MRLIPALIVLQGFATYLVKCQCPYGSSLTFGKVAGYAPSLPPNPPLLYSISPGAAITAECYNRCRSSPDCGGFVVDYHQTACFSAARSLNLDDLVFSPTVSFFIKVCLPVPKNCTDRAWSAEWTPGYELIGLQHTVIPNVNDRWSCMVACLNQTTLLPCLSANYHGAAKTCTLSSQDKWSSPDSFIPTTRSDTDYLENQCISGAEGANCWHEPVYNVSTRRIDLQLYNITREECGRRCQREQYFRCRGYTWLLSQHGSICFLSSDPAVTAPGPPLSPPLVNTPGAVYIQPITCLNLSVICEPEAMTLTLGQPKFNGRLFVLGHSDTCGVQGRGSDITSLVVPLPTDTENKCNVNAKHAIGSVNRTIATTVIVVQNHQLIQTVNDRVVKVNCLITETSQAHSDNVTLNATFNVKEPGVQSEITGVGGNGTGPEAKARMMVVDVRTGREARDVQLGDSLQLRIEIEPPLNVSMVRAGHLVASSGLDSLLLLDWRGCPPQPTTFPPLSPIGPSTLAADFRAFRFPSSPLLMLSMVLTLCPTVCQPTDCGNGLISFGRRKRSTGESYIEVPLHLAIMVHSNSLNSANASDTLIASFGVPTDGSSFEGEVCMSFLLVSLVALFWLLLQCILLAICCCVVRRQKDRQADTISLRHDFQPRHVTWADDNEIPSKQLRLSTPIET